MTDPDNTMDFSNLDTYFLSFHEKPTVDLLVELHRLTVKQRQWEKLFREAFEREIAGLAARLRLINGEIKDRNMFGFMKTAEKSAS